MNKRERFLSLMIPVSKKLPKVYEDIDDPRNEILIFMPPMPGFPKGKFFVRKTGLFVTQQTQLKEHPDMLKKLKQTDDVSYNGYYATHWMNLYRPEEN